MRKILILFFIFSLVVYVGCNEPHNRPITTQHQKPTLEDSIQHQKAEKWIIAIEMLGELAEALADD